MRGAQPNIRRLANIATKDFFGINDITSKDVAGAFSSETKLSLDRIEKKYNPLMGSRNRLVNEEKDKDCTFGRIRRDADNTTLKHGQYEPDKTERLYSTIDYKQMFVSDSVSTKEHGVDLKPPAFAPENIPYARPAYKISEVEPVLEIGEILSMFKREGDEEVVAIKYSNRPPLTFFFKSASHTEDEETDPVESIKDPCTTPTEANAIAGVVTKSSTRQDTDAGAKEIKIRRPQIDIDNQAGPEGARAPLHELNVLSSEYADRQHELQTNQIAFDRALDKKYDVDVDCNKSPVKGIEHIQKIHKKLVEPVTHHLKETLATSRPFPFKPTIKLDSKGFHIYTNQVPDWTKIRRSDAIAYLKGSIVYNNYDILAINKPYGIASHANSKARGEYDMDTLVAELAKQMLRVEKVFLAHRLDKTTTGLLLFATSLERAQHLNKLFKADDIKKTYLCITKGIPDPTHGMIDIPIGEIEVANKLRSCPAPQGLDEERQLAKRFREAKRAITEYHVIKSQKHAALVELRPKTGVKHQLRCHMSFGLKTPILGDHKYSHLYKLAPQTLSPALLKAFHLRQSKVRTLPVHLHAKSIVIPSAKANGETLFIDSPLPAHFTHSLKLLKLSIDH